MLFATPHILIFVALLLMHYGVDGVQIAGLSPRKHRTSEVPAPTSSPTSSSTSPINTSPNQSSPSPSLASHTSSTSATHTTPNTSLSSSASSLATSASNSASSAESRRVGTIVGAVLGSVVLGSLAFMIVAHFRRRARKARKQPRGSDFFNEPETEMSQTQNGLPLTSLAPLVHRPEPLHFFNISSTNNNTSSSPIMPTATFLDAAGSSRRPLSTGESDGNSDEPSDSLQSPFDTRDLSLDTPLLLQRAVSAGPALSSTSSQLSPLHRDMVGFQKTLEADHKRDISDQSQSITISDPIGDPPPKYIG